MGHILSQIVPRFFQIVFFVMHTVCSSKIGWLCFGYSSYFAFHSLIYFCGVGVTFQFTFWLKLLNTTNFKGQFWIFTLAPAFLFNQLFLVTCSSFIQLMFENKVITNAYCEIILRFILEILLKCILCGTQLSCTVCWYLF